MWACGGWDDSKGNASQGYKKKENISQGFGQWDNMFFFFF
jgi:hypothetical protein